jgi:hypothetical protein
MRDFNEDIVDKIRQCAEISPCPHCGTVLLRGMSREFGYKPFAGRIRDHLPPPIGREFLDHIVELIQTIPNFPRILNRDLRPVLQHARVSSPNAGASKCVHPVFPILWTLTGNLSLPFIRSSFPYPLAIQKRLSLLFSHKTEHSKVMPEIGSIRSEKLPLLP